MSWVVSCPQCRAKNRVRLDRAGAKCGQCGTALPEPGFGHPLEIGDGDLDALIAGSDKPVLVDFWANWCGPCKTMAPVLDQLAKSQSKVRVAKLNTETNQVQPGKYAIRSIPTMVLFHKGREVRRISGAMPLEALRRELATWL
jgi:thioredoxin 2